MRRQLYASYLMHSIDGLAGSMVSIFVPIYLLSLNYGLRQIFVFYIVLYLGILIFFYSAGIFASHFGLRKTILLRFPFLFAYLYLLSTLDKSGISLYLICLLNSVQVAFYWFPLHVLFAKNSDGDKIGNDVGKLFALPQTLAIFGPLIGGAIAVTFGFKYLFLAAVILYLASALPLFFIKEFELSININLRKIFNYFKKYPKYFCAEIIANINGEAEYIIWPIFVFITFNNILSIGVVGTSLAIGGVLFTLLIGNLSDKKDKKKFLKLGSFVLILLWIARYYGQNEYTFYFLSILAGFFYVLINVPFNSIIYGMAKKDHIEDFIIFREIPVTLGRLIVYTTAIILASKIKFTFILAGLSYLYFFIY